MYYQSKMTLLTIQNGEIPLKLFYNYQDVLLIKKIQIYLLWTGMNSMSLYCTK